MGFFSAIASGMKSWGAAAAKVNAAASKDKIIDKITVLDGLEQNAATLKVVASNLQNPALRTVLANTLTVDPKYTSDPRVKELAALYQGYRLALPQRIMASSRVDPIGPLSVIIAKMVENLDLLLRDPEIMFGSSPGASITIEDMTVAGAVAIGYVTTTFKMARFFVYLFNNVTGTGTLPPRYQMDWLKYNAASVYAIVGSEAAMINDRTNIIQKLSRLSSGGQNLRLQTDGVSIAEYGNSADYRGLDVYMTDGLRDFSMLAGETWALFWHDRYEANKYMREWIVTRVGLLDQQKNGLSPESPEYKKLERVVQGYMDKLATIDKKISKYEGN